MFWSPVYQYNDGCLLKASIIHDKPMLRLVDSGMKTIDHKKWFQTYLVLYDKAVRVFDTALHGCCVTSYGLT